MSTKSKTTTFLLCYFLGTLGVHRFYLNKVLTGILMLISGGGLGLWWLFDLYMIASGRMQDREGQDLYTGPPDPDNPNAGFWVRTAAMSVDGILLQLIMAVAIALPFYIAVTLEMDFAFQVIFGFMGGDPLAALIPLVLSMLIGLLYFAYPLSTGHQATPGKRCFDIYVCSKDGDAIGLGRALWRTLCYFISALPFYLGFIMAGFKKKRAFHDSLSGTQVLYIMELDSKQFGADTGSRTDTEAITKVAVAAEPDTHTDGESSSTRGPMVMMVLGALLLLAAVALSQL